MRLASTLIVLLFGIASVRADSPEIGITAVRVGLPDARIPDAQIVKFAAWAPVEVELVANTPDAAGLELVVETPDADGVMTVLRTPLESSQWATGQPIRITTYLRPAAGGSETTLTIRDSAGRAVSSPYRIRNLKPRAPLTYVVLALGSRFPQFELPRPATGAGAAEAEPSTGPIRGGRIELAALEDVSRLPDVWFGYQTADLVVLSTSSAAFVNQLLASKVKLAALREWVRRGGRLVISAGANAPLLQHAAIQDLLPAAIAGTRNVPLLSLYWAARETSQTTSLSGNLGLKSGLFTVANLAAKPGLEARIVIPHASRQTSAAVEPAAIQAAFGLGRVTLVGLDLDRSPFTDFSRQAEFWDWVLREGGASRASVGSEGKPRAESSGPTEDEDEVSVALRTHTDTFEAVPVVSFGSVAFLIALYILIIGPIEYYFLKRVLGRLELTWITFPIIVVTVCAAAMISASAMKGHDLRVNKLDVIDVSTEFDSITGKPSGRVFGTTWFTLFSPKVDIYSPRILPGEGWVKDREASASLVGWVGSPRAGRASLLQRKYDYHSDSGVIADGLDRVPVQVWSTKSFSANWSGAIDPASPVVESRLEHPPGDPSKAIGTFVNRMPFEAVTDCVAFYAGQAFPIGTIVNGQEVRLVLDRGQTATQWLQDHGQLADLLSRGQAAGAAVSPGAKSRSSTPTTTSFSGHLPLWGLLFHEASLRNDEGVVPRNGSLRRLDQSWRLAPDYRSEVIVVGRVLPPAGTIDDAFNGKESPSRLLLKDGRSLPGFARQETYVRLFLKVKS